MRTKSLIILAAFASIGAVSQLPDTSDVIVKQNYKSEAGSIDLAGVCKPSESEISCWNGEGLPNDVLGAELTEVYKKGDITINMKYGHKNRLIVFDVDDRPDRRSEAKLVLQKHLSTPYGSSSSGYQLRNKYNENRMLINLAVPKDQVESQATTSLTEKLEPSPKLEFKLGARLEFFGAKFKIVKIGEKQPADDSGSRLGSPGAQWLVVLVREGAETPLPQGISWTIYGEDGLQIRSVNSEGEPLLAIPTYDSGGTRIPKENRVFQASLGGGVYADAGGDEMYMSTNLNPARIKSVVARCSVTRNLIIKGIPLEPKGGRP